MNLPPHRTRIVATLGPASNSPECIVRLIRAGLDVARLNFSHGDFASHTACIRHIREAERIAGRQVAIMADLPGPKMRLGEIDPEPVDLEAGQPFSLTTKPITGNARRASVTFPQLPQVVKPGDHLFLNDGLIHLEVESVAPPQVHCRILVGGELRSRKGLNLPRIHLGISAFTDRDREILTFALQAGVDAVSQSFVAAASDLHALRAVAQASGRSPLIIAKIERVDALDRLDEILAAADGLMVARGDLGVEVPIETIAVVQKQIIARANLVGKPVITATQMLESMVHNRLPTRAEATDVANAILDGTDAVMLSAESAMGRYPEEAVRMLARIARVTEPERPITRLQDLRAICHDHPASGREEAVATVVEHALAAVPCALVIAPTRTGATARAIARFKPPIWTLAVTPDVSVAQGLRFSCGIHPMVEAEEPDDWGAWARHQAAQLGVSGRFALLVAGPSPRHPEAHHRIEFLPLDSTPSSSPT
jgi:pyruvate kinase